MKTLERFRAVYKGEPVDRPPICGWLGLPFLNRLLNKTPRRILEDIAARPEEIIQLQEDLGMDPLLITVDDRWFSMYRFWRLLYSYPPEALETWPVQERVERINKDVLHRHFTVQTPEGEVTWGMSMGESQVVEIYNAVKEEKDLDLLIKYMPDPETANIDKLTALTRLAGDRAFITHNFIGIWGEAANMRGLVTLSTDIFDRPKFVHKISEFLMNRSIRRVRHLAKSGIHSILYDQSWVGVGFSPEQYREFMLPYDREVVKAARDAGILVSYHNCGRGMAFLDDMVSTGADALETLTPAERSGDFDLVETKRRVGRDITLNGAFNERLFPRVDAQEVKDEVRRCIDAAGDGGRYLLRTCGQIFDTANTTIETERTVDNIRVWTETGREYGCYN